VEAQQAAALMSHSPGDVFFHRDRDEHGNSCNPFAEVCPDCRCSDTDEFCETCHDTGYAPVLVAEHDKWWVRALKRLMVRK